MKYKDKNGQWQELYLKPSGDTLPIGSVVEYDGETVPYGYEEVTDPNNYSTEERRIGTYLGKPLYRITISGTTSSAIEMIPFAGIDKLVNHYGSCMVAGQSYESNGYRPFPFRNKAGNIPFFLSSYNSNGIELTACDGWLNNWYEITLEYTKTTD